MQDFRVIAAGKNAPVILWPEVFGRARSFLREQSALQRSQLFMWSPVFAGAGILCFFALSYEPPVFVSAGLVLLPLIAWAFTPKRMLWHVILGMVLCAGVGFACADLRTAFVYTPILKHETGPVEVRGEVLSLEHLPAGGGVRVVLQQVSIEDLKADDTPRRVRIKLRGGESLQPGYRIKMLAKLNPPSAPVLPGGFDFQRYMYFKGIGAVGFAYGAAEVLEAPVRASLSQRLERFRANTALSLGQRLEHSGAVIAALMVGERGGISEDDQDAMRHAGLAHMLAISGLHVGLFFGVVFFAARLVMALVPSLALYYPIKKYAAVLAMTAAVFYMLAAGMTIPTQRAVLMTAVVFAALLLERTPMSMRLVAFAALVVLVCAPESLVSASFQMSFAAVAGLVAFYDGLRPYWSAWHKKAGIVRRMILYVAGVCMTSVIATLATAPFALYHFQQLAVYSLLSNVLAMPVLAFVVMPGIVLYFVLLPLGLESLVVPVIGRGVGIILSIAHWVSGMDHAVVYSTLWPGAALLFYTAAFLIVILGQGRFRVMALVPFSLFLLLIWMKKQPDILVSSRSDLVAIREDDGSLLFSNLQKERFVRQQWLQAFGEDGGIADKWPGEGRFDDLLCGELGCRQERNGYRVSYLRDLKAFDAECHWADILIASDPVPACPHAVVIDRFDTYRNGAYALYLGDMLIVKNTAASRGGRPWVAAVD